MKLTKIISASAALLMAFSVAGCKLEEDDPYDIITKVDSNNYTVEKQNTEASIIRGYKSTNLQHEGGLVQITINNQSAGSNDGVLGFIWDYKESTTVKGAKDFYVIGVNYGYKDTKKFNYYVSKFENIVDIQAANFGASKDAVGNNPKETMIKDWTAVDGVLSSEKINVVVDVTMGDDGSYSYSIYNVSSVSGEVTKDNYNKDNTAIVTGTIDANKTGYNKKEQNLLCLYANVYGNKKLSGAFKFLDTYKVADVVEE